MKRIRCLLVLFVCLVACTACDQGLQKEIIDIGVPELSDVAASLTETHNVGLIKQSLQEKDEAGANYPVDFVYRHCYTSYDKNESTTCYIDYAIKINTSTAKEQFGEQRIPYIAGYDNVKILKATVYTPDGREIETDVSRLIDRAPDTDLVYTDTREKIITLKGLENGSVLRIAYKKSHPGYSSDVYYLFDDYGFNHFYPQKEVIAIWRFQKGMKIKVKEDIRANKANIYQKNIVLANKDSLYVYKMDNIQAIEDEPYSIPFLEIRDQVSFYTDHDWNDVSKWYNDLVVPAVKEDGAILAKVKELTKDLTTKTDKIKASIIMCAISAMFLFR